MNEQHMRKRVKNSGIRIVKPDTRSTYQGETTTDVYGVPTSWIRVTLSSARSRISIILFLFVSHLPQWGEDSKVYRGLRNFEEAHCKLWEGVKSIVLARWLVYEPLIIKDLYLGTEAMIDTAKVRTNDQQAFTISKEKQFKFIYKCGMLVNGLTEKLIIG